VNDGGRRQLNFPTREERTRSHVYNPRQALHGAAFGSTGVFR
jgi:hypothetical protein